jgi:uncharacterized protein
MSEKFPGEDPAALQALLKDSPIGHVAFVADDQPVVLPIAIAHDAGSVLLHGSSGSRWLRLIAQGIPVSMAITAVDGLVVARSAFESSMHYRSAILFGTCSPIPDEEKTDALDRLTEALIPGRVAEVRRPHRRELAATLVLRLAVDDWSYKVSAGWPDDPEEDVAGAAWAGVLPQITRYEQAIPTHDLRAGAAVPESVQALLDNENITGFDQPFAAS